MKSMIFVLALGLMSPYVFAGTESSGGGPSVFCPGASSPEGIAQLYDFFEGRLRRGFNIPVTNSASKEEQAQWALRKLESIDYVSAQAVRYEYELMLKSIVYLPDGILMTGVNDLGAGEAPLVPANCQLAYAAYFESTGQLSVARLLYDRFTETERAALLIHEALYAVARRLTNQMDSRSTRILNAFLFSTVQQPTDLVKKALSTLHDPRLGMVIPIKLNGSERRLSFRASCGSLSSESDGFAWGADVTFWGAGAISGGTGPYPYEGAYTPRIWLRKGEVGEALIHFNPTTRTIVFKNSEIKRWGRCAGENLELFYGSQKVLAIPADIRFFTIRLYPQN